MGPPQAPKRPHFATAISLIALAFGFDLTGHAPPAHAGDAEPPAAAEVQLPFRYRFGVEGRLEETGRIENSSSPYWWVSSGGYMDLDGGYGQTARGDLPEEAKWRKTYALANPLDTDGGRHPQNLFRMTSRTEWQDIDSEISFRIDRTVMSPSLSRKASNGFFLMSRYADQDNLYYAGIRVDGQAVIKKKVGGRYYTLADAQAIDGPAYDRLLNPNLLPKGTWIRMRNVTENLEGGRVAVRLYVDIGQTGSWTLALQAIDDGARYGRALTEPGHVGIRTDFMDVTFDEYRLAPP